MDISKYIAGLGQEAKELPPNWRCFTEAEVERIVSLAVLDALNGRRTNMAIITREVLEQADKENKSDRQIAIENGVTRQAVYQMRKKYGMTKPKN
jgi:hypothetical protein